MRAAIPLVVAGSCAACRPETRGDRTLHPRGRPSAAATGSVDRHRIETWRIDREAGEVIDLTVRQQGADLLLAIRRHGATGAEVEENFARGTGGTESILWIAPERGRWDLEIQLANRDGRGSYALTVAPARLPDDRDRRVAAAQALTRAGRRAADVAGDELPVSLASFSTARDAWRELGDPAREVEAIDGIGRARDLLGDKAGSLAIREEGLRLAREGNDPGLHASLAFGVARMLDFRGEAEAAIGLYRESIQLARRAGDAMGEGKSLANLCLLAADQDETQRGLELCEEAIAAFATAGDEAPYVRIALGTLHHDLGNRDAALEQFTRARDVFVKQHLLWGEATANEYIASVHLADGDAEKALAAFEAALAVDRETGNREGMARCLSGLGQALQMLGRHAEAEPRHEDALALAKEVGSPYAKSQQLAAIARCRAAAGDLDEAARLLGEAVTLAVEARAPSIEASARADLARVRRAAGDPAEAMREVDRALALVERVRDRIAAPELRVTYSAPARAFYDLRIELLMERGDREAALLTLERSRARALLETLAAAGADPEGGAPPEVIAELAAARDGLAAAEARQTRALAERLPAEEIAATGRAVQSALRAVQVARAKARARSPEYAALLRPPDATLASVRAALPPDAVLLEYWLGEKSGWLWAIGRQGVDAWPLPGRAEVEAKALAFHAALVSRNEWPEGESDTARRARIAAADAALPAASQALSDLVLAPAKSRLAPKVWIAADGVLQYVPFAALDDPGAPGRMLVEEREVATVPSAAVLVALRKVRRARAPHAVAIVADPVFSADDARLGGTDSAGRTRGLPIAAALRPFDRLRFSRDEAQSIAALVGTDALLALDFDASREAITGKRLGEYRIVHFAVHGVVDARQPELSGLVLSLVDAGGKPQNGMLRLHEIYEMRLGADLVVLSACQTALGKDVRGEGLVGLTRGFLHAGASRVVASLWQVHDRGTAELMTRFYEGMLREKKPAATALRDAQRSMLADPKWRAPYYWSAFVLQGDPGS